MGFMDRRSTSISNQSFTLYLDKEQMDSVHHCFHVVVNAFSKYVLVMAGMSTSRRLCEKMLEFYVMLKGIQVLQFSSCSIPYLFFFTFF